MLTVVQAFDRAPIQDVPFDDAAALERKLGNCLLYTSTLPTN